MIKTFPMKFIVSSMSVTPDQKGHKGGVKHIAETFDGLCSSIKILNLADNSYVHYNSTNPKEFMEKGGDMLTGKWVPVDIYSEWKPAGITAAEKRATLDDAFNRIKLRRYASDATLHITDGRDIKNPLCSFKFDSKGMYLESWDNKLLTVHTYSKLLGELYGICKARKSCHSGIRATEKRLISLVR